MTTNLLDEPFISSHPHRQELWQQFKELPDPVAKDQAWRFATTRKYRIGDLTSSGDLSEDTLSELSTRAEILSGFPGQAVLAGNQIAAPLTLDDEAASLGVMLKSLGETSGVASSATLGGGKFQALNGALSKNGILLTVPDHVELKQPIVIVHWTGAGGSFPQVHVETGVHSRLQLVELYFSMGSEAGFNIASTRVRAGSGSHVSRTVVRNWNHHTTAVHLEHLIVQRDAYLQSTNFNINGGTVRQETVLSAEGQGADARLNSLSIAGEGQEFDQRTLQSHEASSSRSDLLFKNALLAGGRTIFSGLIRVAPDAQHTDAYQTNRNLLLDPSAEANSLPGLEILANDVKCSHGATSGQIDDAQLFYMRSRGINDRLARQLLVFGFFEEVIEKMQLPALECRIREWIAARFQ
jgi:Fe-S cluster assembly protein SufD